MGSDPRIPRMLKYELSPGTTIIGLDKHVVPRAVAWGVGEHLFLWAEVSDPIPAHTAVLGRTPGGIEVLVIATGEEVPPQGFEYLGTATGGPMGPLGPPMVMHAYWRHRRTV